MRTISIENSEKTDESNLPGESRKRKKFITINEKVNRRNFQHCVEWKHARMKFTVSYARQETHALITKTIQNINLLSCPFSTAFSWLFRQSTSSPFVNISNRHAISMCRVLNSFSLRPQQKIESLLRLAMTNYFLCTIAHTQEAFAHTNERVCVQF